MRNVSHILRHTTNQPLHLHFPEISGSKILHKIRFLMHFSNFLAPIEVWNSEQPQAIEVQSIEPLRAKHPSAFHQSNLNMIFVFVCIAVN